MEEKKKIERRKYPRVKITGIVQIYTENKHIYGSLHDISEGGIQVFTSNDSILPGETCHFLFKIAGNKEIAGQGKIVYNHHVNYREKQGTILGIQFSKMDFHYFRRIQTYVTQHEQASGF